MAAKALGPMMDVINQGRLPTLPVATNANDNDAMVNELRALRGEVSRLQDVVAGSSANVARATIGGAEMVTEEVRRSGDKTAGATRLHGNCPARPGTQAA